MPLRMARTGLKNKVIREIKVMVERTSCPKNVMITTRNQCSGDVLPS